MSEDNGLCDVCDRPIDDWEARHTLHPDPACPLRQGELLSGPLADAPCDCPPNAVCHPECCPTCHGGAAAEAIRCAWFALCDRLATHTRRHPTLGDVPICDRCEERIS